MKVMQKIIAPLIGAAVAIAPITSAAASTPRYSGPSVVESVDMKGGDSLRGGFILPLLALAAFVGGVIILTKDTRSRR